MATLHIQKPVRPINYIKVEVDISGQSFSFDYKIPDAPGNVSPTDVNRSWMDETFRVALRGKFGRME